MGAIIVGSGGTSGGTSEGSGTGATLSRSSSIALAGYPALGASAYGALRNPIIFFPRPATAVVATPSIDSWEDLNVQPTYLQLFVNDVRLALDDPAVGKKYSDSEIIRLGGLAMRQVFKDLTAITTRPVVLTHDIAINSTTLIYYLPPSIGEVLHIGEFDTTNNNWKWKLQTRSRFNSNVRSMRFEGRRIRLEAPATAAFTLRIEYIPGTDYYPHEAVRTFTTATLADNKTFALVEPGDETDFLIRGFVDARPQAYIGSLFRVWRLYSDDLTAPRVEERIITNYAITPGDSGKQRVITLDADLDTAIVQDGVTEYQYEIVPIFWEGVRQCMAVRAALTLAGMSGMREKEASLTMEYRTAIRNERLLEAYMTQDNKSWDYDTDESQRAGNTTNPNGFVTRW